MTNVLIPDLHEFIEYLADLATPEEILAFEMSEERQEHATDLAERNAENDLTGDKRAELEQLSYLDAVISRLKSKALKDLKGR